jgi:hypothetical protein
MLQRFPENHSRAELSIPTHFNQAVPDDNHDAGFGMSCKLLEKLAFLLHQH